MNYQLEVGDQLYRKSPLVQTMPTSAPSTSVGPMPSMQYTPQPKTYEEICQTLAVMEQRGQLTEARAIHAESALAKLGYPTMSKCAHNSSSPFESEVVQYALLFALLYVVIKKV